MKHQAFVSAVVYSHNDEELVTDLMNGLDGVLNEHFELYEIILVDDWSTDGTQAAVESIVQELEGAVTVVQLGHEHGVEAGIVAGLDRALGDFIIEIDTPNVDFDLSLIHELYLEAASGFDIVAGATTNPDRRSRWFYGLVNRYSYLDVPLSTERVRVVSRRALNAMLALKEKVRYRKALYALTGYPRKVVPYEPTRLGRHYRRELDRENLSLAFDILISFSDVGLRIAHVISLAFVAISISATVYTVATYLLRDDVVPGWTTVMLFLSVGFAALFLVLSILGEYLTRVLIEVRGRPVYAVRRSSAYLGGEMSHPNEVTVPRMMREYADRRTASDPSD